MSDSTSRPTRRFWQIHLSTAIILMLATGALLGWNLQLRAFPEDLGGITKHYAGRGWPLCYLATNDDSGELGCGILVSPDEPVDRLNLAIDVLVSGAILGCLAGIFEYVARRRKPQP